MCSWHGQLRGTSCLHISKTIVPWWTCCGLVPQWHLERTARGHLAASLRPRTCRGLVRQWYFERMAWAILQQAHGRGLAADLCHSGILRGQHGPSCSKPMAADLPRTCATVAFTEVSTWPLIFTNVKRPATPFPPLQWTCLGGVPSPRGVPAL